MNSETRTQMLKLRAKFDMFNIASKVDPVTMEPVPFQYTDSESNDWLLINGQGLYPTINSVVGFLQARKNYIYPEDLDWANANIANLFQWNIVAMAKAWIGLWRQNYRERKHNGRDLRWKIIDAAGKNRSIRLARVSKLHLSFARLEYKRNGETVVHSVITDRRLIPLAYRKYLLQCDHGVNRYVETYIGELSFGKEDVLMAIDQNNDGSIFALGDFDLENEIPLGREIDIHVHNRRHPK
ncbi:MAG: hypothetical protein PHT38_00310 [Halothiobacillus sp.]|nr:hypothetical protein [Halothiobacillus sp.]MDY0146524.1 hypothetical protein [Halothiobacillus sp.]